MSKGMVIGSAFVVTPLVAILIGARAGMHTVSEHASSVSNPAPDVRGSWQSIPAQQPPVQSDPIKDLIGKFANENGISEEEARQAMRQGGLRGGIRKLKLIQFSGRSNKRLYSVRRFG